MTAPVDPWLDMAAVAGFGVDIGVNRVMNSAWGWPITEIVHFIGLNLLIGTVGLFDLRMLGVVRGPSLKGLHRLVPFGVAGFALSVLSGAAFVLSTPGQYIYNPAWQTKMALIGIAGVNMIAYYLTTARAVKALGPEEPAPTAARVIALVSLACWLGVIATGRVVTAFRPPFYWCAWCTG